MTLSAYRFLPDAPVALMTMPRHQTVLIDPASAGQGSILEIHEGFCRVYCPCEDTEGMTLAFLQAGDRLRTDRLCSEGICVEALTDLRLARSSASDEEVGMDAVNEWTLQLLRIRHYGQAEKRLHALFALLVNRLGKRCSDCFQLPFRLTHDRLGELIGATRVTTTRQVSKWRNLDEMNCSGGEFAMNFSVDMINSAPFSHL